MSRDFTETNMQSYVSIHLGAVPHARVADTDIENVCGKLRYKVTYEAHSVANDAPNDDGDVRNLLILRLDGQKTWHEFRLCEGEDDSSVGIDEAKGGGEGSWY